MEGKELKLGLLEGDRSTVERVTCGEKRGGAEIRTHDIRDARRRRYRLRYRDRHSYFIFLVSYIKRKVDSG